MMLSNGDTEYQVPGKDLSVSLAMPLARKDISGQTSSTDTVTAGNKAKKLSVALTLTFAEGNALRRLSSVAEAIDDSGDPLTYTIADDLAEAMNIRQVRFAESLRVDPQTGKRAWTVRFTLAEHLSVAEKREQRAEEPTPNARETAGENVSASNTSADAPNGVQMTGFEQFLSSVDKALPQAPGGNGNASA